MIALQETNMAVNYPKVYWNCANLISDSGGDGNPKYDKIASAVARLKNNGVIIRPPYINECEMEFSINGDDIIYGLKPVMGLPTKAAETIIEERKNGKFTGVSDFIERTKTTKSAMLSLIKAGCFDKFGDRYEVMVDYIKSVSKLKDKLTVKDVESIIRSGAADIRTPEVRIIRFRDYICNGTPLRNSGKGPATAWYKVSIEHNSSKFFEEYYLDNMVEDKDYVCMADGYEVKKGSMDKVMKQLIGNFLENEEMLSKVNEIKWKENYPTGNKLSWEIEAIGNYYDKHELDIINDDDYLITNFYELPEEPIISKENYRKYNGKIYPRYEISRIAGTVIAVDKNKNTFILLTKDGPVQCKMFKGQFNNYTRVTDTEENWITKGVMLFVLGYRTDDIFMCKSYNDSAFGKHVLNKLTINDGVLSRMTEKVTGEQ